MGNEGRVCPRVVVPFGFFFRADHSESWWACARLGKLSPPCFALLVGSVRETMPSLMVELRAAGGRDRLMESPSEKGMAAHRPSRCIDFLRDVVHWP